MNLIDNFRTFHPNAEEHTFFLNAHGTFSRIDHILGYKSNLSKFKKIEIISSIFSDHNSMRLDINYRKNTVQTQTFGDFKIMFQITNRLLKKSKGKLKKILEQNDNENRTTQNLWDAAKAVLRSSL